MNVREKRTHLLLEQKGFIVHTVSRPTYRSRSQDIFNLWDHIAVATTDTHLGYVYSQKTTQWVDVKKGQVIFLQTKSRPQYGKDLDKYKEFPGDGFIVVWTKLDNKRYDVPKFYFT